PVDVIHAPAAEPRAVLLLLGEQPVEPGGQGRADALLVPERLERMGCDVGGRLVRHLAEVADRELVEPECLIVDVERAPAAAAGLYIDQLVELVANRGIADSQL